MAIGRGRWVRPVLLSAIGVAAGYALLRAISWRDLHAALARLTPVELLTGFVAYVVFIGFKAARFGALLGNGSERRTLFGIVCAQTFWSNVLPMRAGDLSYVHLLRRKTSATGSEGVASLLVASVLDLWWMLWLALVVGLVFRARGQAPASITVILVVAGVGVAGGVIAFFVARSVSPTWRHRLIGVAERIWAVGPLTGRLMRAIEAQTVDARFVLGLVFSACALIARYGFQLYLLGAMFHDISALEGLFALVFAGLVNLLPIQGVGNVGSIELPWAWALLVVGVPRESAIASGFALHAIVLMYALAAGILGWALIRNGRKETTP